jgi:hypothetical protein
MRRHQEAFLRSTGEIVTWFSDDGIFKSGYLDSVIDQVRVHRAVVGRYTESDHPDPSMLGDDYWRVKHHAIGAGLASIPEEALHGLIFVTRQDAEMIGGWNCCFETPGIGYLDFCIRLFKAKVRMALAPGIGAHFGHMPGETGDHGPMHRAATEHDEPLFRRLYTIPETRDKIVVPLDNWTQQPDRWHRAWSK